MANLYLLCQYVQRPKPGVNTSQKDFGKNPDNWQYDEVVAVSRGLKNRDKYQDVVLNMSTKTVERCRLRPEATWEELYDTTKKTTENTSQQSNKNSTKIDRNHPDYDRKLVYIPDSDNPEQDSKLSYLPIPGEPTRRGH